MQTLQYNRQKLYYTWALLLCILALTGYTFYYEYERLIEGFNFFKHNVALLIRTVLTFYFLLILLTINKLPRKIFNLLGFLIAIPLGWAVSIICFLTIGYEGMTVTGFIFIIVASAVVFDFTLLNYAISLCLIFAFHFILLSFYSKSQPEGLYNHIFLFSLSGMLGLTMNYLVNVIKNNEARVLHERELLLKEIHHRVKNNLQVVSSLLDLQSVSIHDESTKTVVKEGQSRVKSMALIHQLLYQTDNYTSINFAQYLEQLLTILHNTYKKPDKEIKYLIRAENIQLDVDIAVPLGLITNELLTNAYKYAFIDKKTGNIAIEFSNTNNNKVLLRVKDDGIGFPKGFDVENTKTLGLKLVKLLIQQIKAELSYQIKDGAEFKLLIANV